MKIKKFLNSEHARFELRRFVKKAKEMRTERLQDHGCTVTIGLGRSEKRHHFLVIHNLYVGRYLSTFEECKALVKTFNNRAAS